MEGLDSSRPLSLYIHVPFCSKKCDYCAFYSVPSSVWNKDMIDSYISCLIAEIRAINKEWQKPYYTIFIGGGNPGILGYDNLRKILKEASEYGIAEETTIELNPENVSEEILTLKPYLNRVSVGIQSMNPASLKMLGRNSTREINKKALEILSSLCIEFNADIMTSIPGSKVEDTIRDIEEIASYNPGHISLYCLTFEEGTPLVERNCPISEDEEIAMLKSGWDKLKALGYEHYEISNFAKDGRYSKHNSVYWHLGQYIGLGPTAESSIGYSEAISMRNKEDILSYIKDPAFDCIRLTKDETEEEFLLTSLRIKDGIDKREYSNRFGYDFDERYEGGIAMLAEGDYENDAESFHLTEEGMMRLDAIILSLALSI